MNTTRTFLWLAAVILWISSCKPEGETGGKTAAHILGNPAYPAISYGGYRHETRDSVPGTKELKEDMKILSAMGIRLLRTYNTQQFAQAANLLEAIRELKEEDPSFEMYVMLGAWIDCKGAWTDSVDHTQEDEINNRAEIEAAVSFAIQYPDIVKVIAVGNEAMVHWAGSYYVGPEVILKWVRSLRELREEGTLPAGTWITSSDNFASWGGGDASYHLPALNELIHAVDYISMHTYPFHDTHYNPDFWLVPPGETELGERVRIDSAMLRARRYAMDQYLAVREYALSVGADKPIHIGETGWASVCGSFYGPQGSRAADEYKQKRYYELMREWTRRDSISCFFFEAFDEPWKDADNPTGSENHFGLFTVDGKAKHVLWEQVDAGIFRGLDRGGNAISKTYGGNMEMLMEDVLPPPSATDPSSSRIATVNTDREPGEAVTEASYVVIHEAPGLGEVPNHTFPASQLVLNAWEATCTLEKTAQEQIRIRTGSGRWWGCGIEVPPDVAGENLAHFRNGHLHLEIRGSTGAIYQLGFQTGRYTDGDQSNNFVVFGPGERYSLDGEWKKHTIPLAEIDKGADWENVTSLLYLRADRQADGGEVFLKNIYYTVQ